MIYKLFRDLHLILGLLAFPMVLVYGISSVQMAHRIPVEQRVTEEDVSLAPGLTPRAAAQQLMDKKSFTGDLGNVLSTPAAVSFGITRVGSRYQVVYTGSTGQAHVKKTDTGVWGELNRLHHLHGFAHENGAMNAWGWILAAVSTILLIIGATGLYMWFKLHRERTIGVVLLSANLIVSMVLLILLRS